ncbi:MAG: Mrp/NBP35 family ATP-binding protein [Rickettsiales bacterium]
MKPAPELQRPAAINHAPIPHVERIIAVASGKGGVGKSTVTVNLAHALTVIGKRVGILDADIYGPSIPRMLGLETYLKPEIIDNQMVPPTAHNIRAMSMALITGDEAAVLRAPMITKALVQFLRLTKWGDAEQPLDILLVDLPPGTGDVTLSLAQNAPLHGLILVTTPQEIAVIDADKCASAFHKLHVPLLGIVENMSYFLDSAGAPHHLFGKGGGEKLAEKYGSPLLGQVPLDATIGVCADEGRNFVTEYVDSMAAKLYREIAESILN